jgi:hypothetical protein
MREPSAPSNLQAPTDSSVGAGFIPENSDNTGLAAEIQDDLNALALELARKQVATTSQGYSTCGECLFSFASGRSEHSDFCLVGNIIKLVARLGELRDEAAHERFIEYSVLPDGAEVLLDTSTLPIRRVTHEEAARTSTVRIPAGVGA